MLAEPDVHVAVVAGDLAGCERGDAGDVLAVEEDKAAGCPVCGLDAVVVEQPGGVLPAPAVADRGPGVPLTGGEGEGRAVPVAGGPVQEAAGALGRACADGGEPFVDVGLAALPQCCSPPAEPGQEPGGFADRVPGVRGASPVAGPGLGVAPEAAHDLPGGERADEPAVLRGVQGFQQAGQPLLGAGEFLVAGVQDAAGGEDLPEEPGSAGPRVLVERLVGGGRPAGPDIGEDGSAGAFAQPVQCAARVAGCADRLEDGC